MVWRQISGASRLVTAETRDYIAKWDGSAWSALGSGMDSTVNALAVDGSGDLVRRGQFHHRRGRERQLHCQVGRQHLERRWARDEQYCLRPGCDGLGNLYAGGDFTTAGGVSANHIAKWDGSAWSALGPGMNGTVNALAFDGGGQPRTPGAVSPPPGDAAPTTSPSGTAAPGAPWARG